MTSRRGGQETRFAERGVSVNKGIKYRARDAGKSREGPQMEDFSERLSLVMSKAS